LEVIDGENTRDLKAEESALPNLAKEVEDNSRYKILEANATVMKLLVDDKYGVSSSEVFDMLHSRDDNEDHMDLPTFPEDTEDAKADVPAMPDSQAEFLQGKTNYENNQEKTVGGFNPPADDTVRKDAKRQRYSSPRGEPAGEAAGIMVVITCSIVCLAYTALIVWRRIYMKRNGLKHELLRNEEMIAETRIEVIVRTSPYYGAIET
ncbi:Lysocardiolipin acyltransferase 1, partial [Operophtera brumata]